MTGAGTKRNNHSDWFPRYDFLLVLEVTKCSGQSLSGRIKMARTGNSFLFRKILSGGIKMARTDPVRKNLASQEPIEIHIRNQSKFINFNSGCSTQPFNAVFEYYQSRGLASELEWQQSQGSSILAVVIIFALVYG